jgi:predicted nucleic acid-binding Zn ribbon protein
MFTASSICPKCKSEMPERAAFCPSCGKKISSGKGRSKIASFALFVILAIMLVGGGVSYFADRAEKRSQNEARELEWQIDRAKMDIAWAVRDVVGLTEDRASKKELDAAYARLEAAKKHLQNLEDASKTKK